jgi:hypothetical protein
MTTIALKGFSAANLIVDSIVSFFKGLGKAVIMARGVEANYKIAQDLRHEYPDMSVPAIAAMLNDRLRKEVYGD